ncbi:MAG TPA: lipid-A-disaccharide synthase N-terminal domain-containing protein [Tepidisphaeraceae bacterium]|nr:lipid-A-disaccharide synthase N-terminal domain-containing protein [Tepidisphaeraceae bacterium]
MTGNLIVVLAGTSATPTEWAWFWFGILGNIIFGSRFFVQWIHSERHKESRVPEAFWWISVVGSLILLMYFTHKRELVGVLGSGPNLIPYTRNLILIYRKKRKGEPDAAAAAPIPGTTTAAGAEA